MKIIGQLIIMLLFTCKVNGGDQNHPTVHADSHAPIGVMGDHLHKKNEWMFSYRFMRMEMADNIQGSDNISSEDIVTTVPNRFFGQPMMPPTLRVVPQSMTSEMHMFGIMFAPNDDITWMAMLNVIDKTMQHLTFAGGKGKTPLGQFTSNSSGVGDFKLSALTSLYQDDLHKIHINMGLSFPTGATNNTDEVLTPMNMYVEQRLPYGM